MSSEVCRNCGAPLEHVFVDLGMSPIANDYVAINKANAMEPFFPLCVYVCNSCWLVQLPAVQSADNIFRDDYAYFSSVSKSIAIKMPFFATINIASVQNNIVIITLR